MSSKWGITEEVYTAHQAKFGRGKRGLSPDAITRAGVDRVAQEMAKPADPARALCPLEHDEQVSLIEWVDLQIASGTLPELEMLFAVPNGGLRSKRTAGKLYAEGVRPGVPDLCLASPARNYHGLYIEMKRSNPKLCETTPHQQHWHRKLEKRRYCVRVCYGWEAARSVLLWYLGVTTAE